jgi:hypothetical protein
MKSVTKILLVLVIVGGLYCLPGLLTYFRSIFQNDMYLNDVPWFWRLNELYGLGYTLAAIAALLLSVRLTRARVIVPMLLLLLGSLLLPAAYIVWDAAADDGGNRANSVFLKLQWGTYAILSSFFAHFVLLALLCVTMWLWNRFSGAHAPSMA